MERPRVRNKATGRALPLPRWEEARDGGFLEHWATTLMLMNVSTRKFDLAVRLAEAAVPAGAGSGRSKSAVSRRLKALSEAKFMAWMSSDLLGLDLLVIRIDGLHMGDELLMIGAIGVDSSGKKHPLGVVEGATENAAVVQAMLDNLIERGLDPEICRLSAVDGAQALSTAVLRTFGADTPIQGCQIHKGRNIVDRLPGHLHAGVRRTLRQAWEFEDAAKAERLLRNLAWRLEQEAPSVSGTILEGLDEILTVIPARTAAGTQAFARLHQHDRECLQCRVPGVSQRVTLAQCPDGSAMAGRRDAGSREGPASPQGVQATAGPEDCTGEPSQRTGN